MAIINQLGNAGLLADVLGPVPAGKNWAITNILVCNFDASTTGTFSLYLIPSGESADDNNTVIKNLDLPPEETFTFDTERIILDPGDKVSFEASSVLSMTISYMEV